MAAQTSPPSSRACRGRPPQGCSGLLAGPGSLPVVAAGGVALGVSEQVWVPQPRTSCALSQRGRPS